MHKIFALVASALLGASLAGCSDSASVDPVDGVADLGEDANSNVIRLSGGIPRVVRATAIHPEVEGESTFPVDQITSGDPTILAVEPQLVPNTFMLRPLREGETVISLFSRGDRYDRIPVKVLPFR